MLQYKANLTLLHSRYGDLELRIIELFAANPTANAIDLPESMEILVSYLLQDGLLSRGATYGGIAIGTATGTHHLGPRNYVLTDKGREFVNRWMQAQELG